MDNCCQCQKKRERSEEEMKTPRRMPSATQVRKCSLSSSLLKLFSLVPEGAVRILTTAELPAIKERFAARMCGNLPATPAGGRPSYGP